MKIRPATGLVGHDDYSRDREWEARRDSVTGVGNEHVVDHRSLWEALLFLSRRVIYLEHLAEGGDED